MTVQIAVQTPARRQWQGLSLLSRLMEGSTKERGTPAPAPWRRRAPDQDKTGTRVHPCGLGM